MLLTECSVDRINKNRIVGAGENYVEKGTASRVLGGKLEEKRAFGRTGLIWDMLKFDLTSERNSVNTMYI